MHTVKKENGYKWNVIQDVEVELLPPASEHEDAVYAMIGTIGECVSRGWHIVDVAEHFFTFHHISNREIGMRLYKPTYFEAMTRDHAATIQEEIVREALVSTGCVADVLAHSTEMVIYNVKQGRTLADLARDGILPYIPAVKDQVEHFIRQSIERGFLPLGLTQDNLVIGIDRQVHVGDLTQFECIKARLADSEIHADALKALAFGEAWHRFEEGTPVLFKKR